MLTAKMIPADGCVMGFIVRKGIELVYVAVYVLDAVDAGVR